ncbi:MULTISPECIES: NTP/NDP exchange transporter [Pseudomonas]|uniref:NTP/NDP exchange transporter n=1 Tax=Pseudomonas TaxID=286 RepID=UPI001BEC65A5|nr:MULTISPECIES: MFS transporter [Pseudomonas]MBT2341640.1 MFS transporter [Pseudomonas fluorescens]MCD4531109.1 MFS transporter [Pseudomonas sp. C3-2018]
MYKVIGKFIDIRPQEMKALGWSWLYIFSLFLAYYVLRPIRDELGVAGGVRNLPWLFTGTLVVMLVLHPFYSYIVRSWPRERFIAIAYRFFMLNLVGFAFLLAYATPEQNVWVGRAFFIWVSVFNLFVVSVFWSLVVDVFSSEQGKRLFGFLAAGATVGGMAGSALIAGLIESTGQAWLLAAAVVLLEVSVFASKRLSNISDSFLRSLTTPDPHQPVGGGIFSGISHIAKSPYLLGIAAFIVLYSITSTTLYFQQASIVEANIADKAARTAFFASIDFWVNAITLVFQLFVASQTLRLLGVTATLCLLPLASVIGFSALAMAPTIGVFVAVQVVRRVCNFALTRPAREILFTSVSREDRYKTKNLIDTAIYRTGDQIGSWSYAGLLAVGLTATGISMVAVPLSILWLLMSVWLGRRQGNLERIAQLSNTQ